MSSRNTEMSSKFPPGKEKLGVGGKRGGSGSSRRSLRLSCSLYDFQVDSLPAAKPTSIKCSPAQQTKPASTKRSAAPQKAPSKTKKPKIDSKKRKTANTNAAKPTLKQGATQRQGKKALGNIKKKKETKRGDVEEQCFITPKARLCKVLCAVNQNSENFVNKRMKTLKPIAQPNLDDVSPIFRKDSITPGQKRTRRQRSTGLTGENVQENKNMITGHFSGSILESPPVSFLGQPPAEMEEDADDSAVFVSPRKVMRKLKKGQTSTPANVLIKKGTRTKKGKRCAKSEIKVKATSTPIEVKTKRCNEPVFTRIKPGVMDMSSVHLVETPTSDYGSMESFTSPSPSPVEKRQKKGRCSPTPAFTLEEDIDVPSLNKSMNKVYRRSKKKYESSKTMASKLEEWADKVNSEMEDVENFELSVEG